MVGIRGYEASDEGSEFDSGWTEDVAKALGRVVGLSLYPFRARTATAADLSGGAETLVVMHTERACTLYKAILLYEEASSADAGITLEIGKESDRNYYYTGTSEVSKAQWYTLPVTLLKTDVLAGDTVTFYSPGGKAGTGTVMCIIEYGLTL